MIKAHINLDIIDIALLIEKWANEQGIEPVGFTITSWNQVLVKVDGSMVVEPVRHSLVPQRVTITA